MRNVNFLFGLLIVTLLTCTITSHVGAISTDNENAFLPSPTAVEIVYAAFTPTSFLYFPHVSTVASWGSEITVINYSSKTVMGTMRGYDSIGNEVNYLRFDLPAHGRREINVANTFGSSSGISYAVFESDSDTVLGYTKFFVEGKYRAALPAVSQPNSGDFYIPHIASNSAWWTGVGLVNTTSSSKLLTFTFNNGATRTVSLAPKEHQSFTISSLFGGQTPSDINSATVTGGDGVVGLGLFGSKEGSGMNYLSGVLLKGSTATNIYFPHVASDATWCTGIVAYNPSSDPCTITVLPYTQNGVVLETRTIDLPGKSKYIGTAVDLNLPSGTAWFEVEAINPITGFELFGTKNGNQLAGYTGVGISATEGIFPKIEDSGWTGIAFVNIDDSPAFITLTAHDDNGDIVAVKSLTLGGHSKIVGLAENLFSGSISGATYIRYSSDMNVVGFQLNGSNDNMMLDALPGISVETADGLVIDDEGGSLSLLDEQGNRIEIIFPRGALDTPTNISVELLPEQLGLPIGTRHASAFIVKPYNVELYQPVTIRISYNKAIEDIRRTALYRNRGEILAPLADHKFGVDSKSIEARAFRLGEFVEGKMSMEQIIDQVTLIFDSYGISWG
ncbi:MAG: hypothetical protein JW836_11290, partial [Deltaproteobacteria bacterium]|nr:hypothetical protein [Deltaproteobacteria bacterium]